MGDERRGAPSCNNQMRVDSLEWWVFNPMIDLSGNNIVKRERKRKRGREERSYCQAIKRNERALRLLSINTLACRPTAGRMKIDASDEVKWKRRYTCTFVAASDKHRYAATCKYTRLCDISFRIRKIERESAQFFRNWPSLSTTW